MVYSIKLGNSTHVDQVFVCSNQTSSMQFQLVPFAGQCVFIFCNRKRNAIKILRYDSNGFILAGKKLLDGLKIQWPKTPGEVKLISSQQVEWLFQGLEIEQKKVLRPVEMSLQNTCL